NSAGRQDQNAVGSFTAEGLLPGEGDNVELGEVELLGKGSRGSVADGQAFAVRRNPVSVGNADARGGAVPGEDDVTGEVDLGEVRQFAIRGFEDADVVELELRLHVGAPACAERFPGQHVDATSAQSAPEEHFDSARVGGGDDTDAVISRNFEQL